MLPVPLSFFTFEHFKEKDQQFDGENLKKYSIILSKIEDNDINSHFFELANFGSNEQSDLAQISNSLLSVNKNLSFDDIKAKHFNQYIKKESGFFSFLSSKSNKQEVLNHFKSDICTHSSILKDQSMMFNLIYKDVSRVERNILDALTILKEIINYLSDQSILSLEEASMHPIIASRLVSLQNSLLVVNQLAGTINMAILSIQREIELSDNFVSVVYPALSISHINNAFGNNSKTDKDIIAFFKK